MNVNIPIKTILNGIRVRNYGKPFYAADLGLNGGEINGLIINHYIKPTGNTKTVLVKIDDGLFKECEVKEWKYSHYECFEYDWWKKYEIEIITQATIKAELLLDEIHQLGF